MASESDAYCTASCSTGLALLGDVRQAMNVANRTYTCELRMGVTVVVVEDQHDPMWLFEC